MFARARVCVCVCVCVYMLVCVRVCVCACVCTYMRVQVYTCVQACVHACVCEYMRVCMRIVWVLLNLVNFGELSLKNGDLVYLESRVDKEWLRGHTPSGNSGIFPVSMVEIVVSEHECVY